MSRNLPYNRADRIAQQIYQVAASFIYEDTDDERLIGIQITRAAMTNDLSIARIYFYLDGGKDKQEAAKHALEAKRSGLKHKIGQELLLKIMPRIDFFLDEGVENAERIEEILKNLKSEV
ncbi:MAG: ribosome-binding factor A [Deltaproteobacteria bacterium CG11_big_fil_rev_8_21_14_0_20_49_13]|nr:MAG: ribosome-binding factor A [Deltaproteobacteria bacterium CG11_big_fil_rev_8_21_14_0_20_49_13]